MDINDSPTAKTMSYTPIRWLTHLCKARADFSVHSIQVRRLRGLAILSCQFNEATFPHPPTSDPNAALKFNLLMSSGPGLC